MNLLKTYFGFCSPPSLSPLISEYPHSQLPTTHQQYWVSYTEPLFAATLAISSSWLSAFSLPVTPQWAEMHWKTIHFPLPLRQYSMDLSLYILNSHWEYNRLVTGNRPFKLPWLLLSQNATVNWWWEADFFQE